jgi:putative FmdB family regulatory protein
MPFYEYRRPDGSTFEVMQKMTDPPLTHDPDSGAPVERVFHPIAVHFKGKGFYNTDYGTRKRQQEKAAESSSSSDAKGTDGGSKGSSSKGGESASSPTASSSPSSKAS